MSVSALLPARTTDSRAFRIALALGVVYVVWSTTFMAIREALDGLPPFLLCAWRYLAAAALLGLLAAFSGRRRPTPRELWGGCALGFVIVFAPNAPVAWAEQTLPTGVTALLGAASPLFVLALGAFKGDRPTARGVLGILLGLVGLGLIVAPGLGQGLGGHLTAQGGMLLGSFVASLGIVFARHLPVPEDALVRSAVSMGAGGLMFAAAAGLHREAVALAGVPLHAWVGLAYLIVFGSCVGFSAFSYLVQHARPALTSTASFVNPSMAMVVGVLVLGEPLPRTVLAAAVLIVGAVVLVALGGRVKKVAG